jgi:thiol:disulfide interchange protein DsbD
MVWVKKVFGVIMLGVGAFYLLLAVAPTWSYWVLPVVLLAGGLYLGFLERSGAARAGFRRLKWATGALALIGGALLVITTPSQGLAFRAYADDALAADFARGKPAMLDFTANWCVPCHELDRATFSDRRVIAALKPFEVYKVDLTRYDSPESERLRRQYGITGVPTVVFLTPKGREVRTARVEGFMPPERFLERVREAAGQGVVAAP